MSADVKLITNPSALIGESPVWDAREQVLFWVDIIKGHLFKYTPNSKEQAVYQIGETVGSVVLREAGGLVLATENGFQFFDPETSTLEPIIDPEPQLPDNRFNDGKCDMRGRFWAGTMEKAAKQSAGALYCLDTDQTVTKKLDHLTISNGLIWNLENTVFYHIDSLTFSVMAYDYHPDSGEITNGRVVISIKPEQGIPDGMTIDAEGKLWIAHYGGSAVRRWNPDSNEILDTIHLPVPKVTACAFGGAALDTLYITTASDGLTADQLASAPLSGGLFSVKTGLTGVAPMPYQG